MAQAIREWLRSLGVSTLFIEPGSPWENGYIESFNGKLRDELLNGEIFYTLHEAKVLIEMWRLHYSQVRPHPNSGCGTKSGGRSIPTKRTGSPGKSKFSRHVATIIYIATFLAVLGFLFQSLRAIFPGN